MTCSEIDSEISNVLVVEVLLIFKPMKIEHFALNVSQPKEMAQWYVDNLDMKIVMSMDKTPNTHFLTDENGCMIEIYCNDTAEIPDYHKVHPLVVHLAFTSNNPSEDVVRLQKAGATLFEEVHLPDGSHLSMMRDPWGIAIQFCKRGTPMV